MRGIITDAEKRIEGVDTLVVAFGSKPSDELYSALKGKVKELHRVGQCIAHRTMLHSIWDGTRVGRAL